MLFLSWHNVNAACDYNEQAALNTKAASIKAVYEEKIGTQKTGVENCENNDEFDNACEHDYYYFTVSILNMSPEFYVTVKSSQDSNVKTYYYEDVKNAVITFDLENIMDVNTLTFEVYSSYETNCAREKIRVFYLTTPRYNPYYEYGFCANVPEYYLCQKYVTFNDIKLNEAYELTQEYEKELNAKKEPSENLNFFEKIFQFIEDNKGWFIGGTLVVVVIGAGVGAYIIIKRKRSAL